jgi:hypothetical protein
MPTGRIALMRLHTGGLARTPRTPPLPPFLGSKQLWWAVMVLGAWYEAMAPDERLLLGSSMFVEDNETLTDPSRKVILDVCMAGLWHGGLT